MVALLFWEQEVAGSNPVIPKTPLVQLVERRFPKPNAVGSSPTGRDINITFTLLSQKNTESGRSMSSFCLFVLFFVVVVFLIQQTNKN